MKKLFNISILTLSFIVIAACDSGFDELNTIKTSALAVDPTFELNSAIVNAAPPAGSLVYEMAIVQQIITSNTGVNVGGNFNQVNTGSTPANWVNFYQTQLKYCADVIQQTGPGSTGPNSARTNLYHMARIMRAYGFMVLTDTYGDVPYTEAVTVPAKGFINAVTFPKYDTQQTIYTAIITELKDATVSLSSTAPIETADALYAGSIARWQKFGYSLLLRAGMRLAKVDPTTAQTTVAAAFAGGVILTNADNAQLRHDGNFNNPIAVPLTTTEAANFYLTNIFVNNLNSRNDPRIPAIAVRYVGATSGTGQVLSGTGANGTSVASNQYGMPMGSTDASADAAGGSLPGSTAGKTNRYAFSQADRTRVASKLAPNFLVSAAQTNFLLAEAVQKGMITSTTTPLQYFQNGIKAHMDQMATYPDPTTVSKLNTPIDPTAIATYVASRSTAFVGNEIAEINYEYWVASFMAANEAWANFRRSGYPVLPPNPYIGVTVPFINRITYPPSENLVNNANYTAASSSIGGDGLGTKVWWNK